MAHGLHLATGAAAVDMEGNTIDIVNGYPDAETIVDTLADVSGFDAPSITGNDTATISKTGAPGTCEVVYVEAGANTPPSITFDVSGC
jgi:hypothetical protein